jgi:isoleucyl-tRNA synthetase
MFRPVDARPDLVSIEHEMLRSWREEGVFERLRAQTMGGPAWSFLDGPITANNPMGVHHAWGRTYKDLFQRFRASLGHELRWQQGFDCQGLWVEVNVERELGYTSKRQIEEQGLAEFISLCKQRVLTYAARQTEQSIRLGMWMDWNDPAELLKLRDALAEGSTTPVTIAGVDGPVSGPVEQLIGRLGTPEVGGSYFTFSDENNDLIWTFLATCHARGWLYKGSDSMPWCARCGTGISQHEMTEGYADREDPSLYFGLALVDRPGEELVAWTTTPWTVAANVAAAVHPTLDYELVEFDGRKLWIGASRRTATLGGGAPRAVLLETRKGSELIGWQYRAPFDDLPAVREALGPDGAAHRVIGWDDVGSEEGTCIVHIAPGCGSDDHKLGVAEGLPAIAPIDESGLYLEGFGTLSGREWHEVTEDVFAHLTAAKSLLRREKITHRYPHCWRCATPLVFRLVDEWFISMGPLYDKPRSELTKEELDTSLRYQIMSVVDRITWLPEFGYERELDWLRNMSDWMISKKRYWGLALPIYECASCGKVEVLSSRKELEGRATAGAAALEGHTAHRPYIDEVQIDCSGCGAKVTRVPDVGNPWLDAGIVSFSTLRYREDPEYWKRWFPADFITESFPGQFRNWFYSLLAMSTVMASSEPTKTIFGYGLVVGADGRAMHKSWGNSIEFDEAADRMGADVMRWLFVGSRPEENVLFGWEAADETRRRLLVLWNVYAFLVGQARSARWTPGEVEVPASSRSVMDRWILSRSAELASSVETSLRAYDAYAAVRRLEQGIDELSTWYLRRTRDQFAADAPERERHAAFDTLHQALLTLLRVAAPISPFFTDSLYRNLVGSDQTNGSATGAGVSEVVGGAARPLAGAIRTGSAPGSIHLLHWPTEESVGWRDSELELAMERIIRAAELGRSVRSAAGIRTRQPLARARVVLGVRGADAEALQNILADELNVKSVERVDDASGLFERRVKVLLPKVAKRLGASTQVVMQAARDGKVEFLANGAVSIAGAELAADEIEIQAVPREGQHVAEDDGLVVELDTSLTPALIVEGDAREVIRAVQEARKSAGLQREDRVEMEIRGAPSELEHHRGEIVSAVGALRCQFAKSGGAPLSGWERANVALSGGDAELFIRRATE